MKGKRSNDNIGQQSEVSQSFVMIPTQVLEAGIGPLTIGLYAILRNHLNHASGRCDPSVPRLATLTGLSHDVVEQQIRVLEKSGVVEVDRAKGKRNRYRFPTVTTRSTACSSTRSVACGSGKVPDEPHDQVHDEVHAPQRVEPEEPGELNTKSKRGQQSAIADMSHSLPVFPFKEQDEKPPTLNEVELYCNSRRSSVDPETIWNFCASIGWLHGRKPLDWRAEIRRAERNGYYLRPDPTVPMPDDYWKHQRKRLQQQKIQVLARVHEPTVICGLKDGA